MQKRLEEQRLAQIVEEERMKLLRKHAGNLLGFLPRDLLKESDLEFLGDEVRKELSKKDTIDPLAALEELYQ